MLIGWLWRPKGQPAVSWVAPTLGHLVPGISVFITNMGIELSQPHEDFWKDGGWE